MLPPFSGNISCGQKWDPVLRVWHQLQQWICPSQERHHSHLGKGTLWKSLSPHSYYRDFDTHTRSLQCVQIFSLFIVPASVSLLFLLWQLLYCSSCVDIKWEILLHKCGCRFVESVSLFAGCYKVSSCLFDKQETDRIKKKRKKKKGFYSWWYRELIAVSTLSVLKCISR